MAVELNLEQLLDDLTPNGRVQAVIGMIKKRVEVPQSIIDETMRLCEEHGLNAYGQVIARDTGAKAELVKFLEGQGMFDDAINIAHSVLSDDEIRGIYERAVDYYERWGKRFPSQQQEYRRKAFEFAAKGKLTERLIQFNLEDGHVTYAAQAAKGAGDVDRAIEMLETHGLYGEGAKLAKEHKKEEKAKELYTLHLSSLEKKAEAEENNYIRRTTLEEAVGTAEKLGLKEKVIELLEKLKKFKGASEYAQKLGLTDRAIGLLIEAGEYNSAAQLRIESGDTRGALEIYREAWKTTKNSDYLDSYVSTAQGAGMDNELIAMLRIEQQWVRAAKAAEHAGRIDEAKFLHGIAIDTLQHSGNYGGAAGLVVEQKDFERGFELYKLARNYERAEDAALKAGLGEKAVEMWADLGEHYKAATLAQKLGLTEKAVENWLKSEYPERAGELLEEQEQNERALEVYKEHGTKYDISRVSEKLGDIETAISVYENDPNTRFDSSPFNLAGRIALRHDLFERAALNFEKAGNFDRAEDAARQGRLTELAEKYAGLNALLKG